MHLPEQQNQFGAGVQGWMFEGDPGQVKGKDLERLRKFVTGFAKRLKYK